MSYKVKKEGLESLPLAQRADKSIEMDRYLEREISREEDIESTNSLGELKVIQREEGLAQKSNCLLL